MGELDSGRARLVTNELYLYTNARMSPDHRWIAYPTPENTGILVSSSGGADARVVLTAEGRDEPTSLVWADAHTLVHAWGGIVRATDVASGKSRLLGRFTDIGWPSEFVGASSDGKYVAYLARGDKAIHVVAVHGGDNSEVALPAIKGKLHGVWLVFA